MKTDIKSKSKLSKSSKMNTSTDSTIDNMDVTKLREAM